jgi:release factor glutamine methyltransferase
MVERASGREGAEHVLGLDEPATELALGSLTRMVERRLAGEPLQYVLGRWGFRTVDLLVDRRVLIPRPETELVVDVALAQLPTSSGVTVVDLGTGSGAIALTIAAERVDATVWATDNDAAALAVAAANLAGLGRPGARVTLAQGSWYEALPASLHGSVDVVVSNPPYVAAGEPLPDEVRLWEPAAALIAGPSGMEAIDAVVRGAPPWLRPGGALVVEIGATQAASARQLASATGLIDLDVRRDLAGLDRVLVARSPASPSTGS